MSTRSTLLLGFAVLASPLAPQAAPVDIVISGTCYLNCANIGVAEGAAIGGSVQVDEASFSPNSFVSGIVNYRFSFGTFALSQADEAISSNYVEWGDTAADIRSVNIFAFASSDSSRAAPYLSLVAPAASGGGAYAASNAYWHVGPDGSFDGSDGDGASLALAPIELAPVPLPASASLLGAGIAALAAFALRGRRRIEAAA